MQAASQTATRVQRRRKKSPLRHHEHRGHRHGHRDKRPRSTLAVTPDDINSDATVTPLKYCALFVLPDEILVRILTSIGALADRAALAMTCHRMAAIWRDDTLWRDLFVRDYGHLYETGLATLSWHPEAHVHAPWPDDAKRFWREMMEAYEPGTCIDDMPFGPDTPYDPRVPTPFAHMTALGKDWKWLYAPHCPVAAGGRLSRTSGTLTMVDTKHAPDGTVSALYRGDVSSCTGLPRGYGICFYMDASGSVAQFLQSMWSDGCPDGWQTLVTSGWATSAMVHGRVARRPRCHTPRSACVGQTKGRPRARHVVCLQTGWIAFALRVQERHFFQRHNLLLGRRLDGRLGWSVDVKPGSPRSAPQRRRVPLRARQRKHCRCQMVSLFDSVAARRLCWKGHTQCRMAIDPGGITQQRL
nr:F-box domain protein [Pandoravirus massiliensis]